VPGSCAAGLFAAHNVREVLELGSGQGRDTLPLLRAEFSVTALDFAADGIAALRDRAKDAGVSGRLDARRHDVREPLPLRDNSFDAVYSHMLLCMALSTPELDALVAEVRRVLRPGGWHVYTVRHSGDAHFQAGIGHGDDMWEYGGFIVHFFTRALVERLATGMELVELAEFSAGALPLGCGA
jgi:SAM-dependent methyltransferase